MKFDQPVRNSFARLVLKCWRVKIMGESEECGAQTIQHWSASVNANQSSANQGL